MNNTRPDVVSDIFQALTVIKQTIDKSSVRIAIGRVNNNPWWFRKDQDTIILKKDIKRNFLCGQFYGGSLKKRSTHLFSSL